MQQQLLFSPQTNQTRWHMVSDQVMGGVSQGQMQLTEQGVNLQGQVSLENNGGFLQIQWPIDDMLDQLDMQNAQGFFIELCAHQNETLELLIKSSQLWMPWQSYRSAVEVTTEWQTVYVPFSAFAPYRTQTRLRPQAMTKFSVLAGGHARQVNFTIRQFGLYY